VVVLVIVWDIVCVGVLDGVCEGVPETEGLTVTVCDIVWVVVIVKLGETDAVFVSLDVRVAVFDGVWVCVCVCVLLVVCVGVPEIVLEGVCVFVPDCVTV
jgi:hypothetical protein